MRLIAHRDQCIDNCSRSSSPSCLPVDWPAAAVTGRRRPRRHRQLPGGSATEPDADGRHGLRLGVETPRWRQRWRSSTARRPERGRSPTPGVEFRLSGTFDDTTRFHATKEGHAAITGTLQPHCAPCNPNRWIHFYLPPLAPSANIAGDYTLTFTADRRVRCLSEPVRTYAATLVPVTTPITRPTRSYERHRQRRGIPRGLQQLFDWRRRRLLRGVVWRSARRSGPRGAGRTDDIFRAWRGSRGLRDKRVHHLGSRSTASLTPANCSRPWAHVTAALPGRPPLRAPVHFQKPSADFDAAITASQRRR